MPKVPLSTITSGYGTVDALNANFDAIEAAFDNTLSRDGDTPNQMQANLDMNGNLILNQGNPITISGFNWEGQWLTATAYQVGDVIQQAGSAYVCVVAHTSGVFATDLAAFRWQLVAQANLPTQTGNSGKYLTTDGTSASWDDVEALPSQTGNAGKVLKTNGTAAAWETNNISPSEISELAKTSNGNGCVLVLTGAVLTLFPRNGGKVFINGDFRLVPSAGVTLSSSGLVANTTYYVYCYLVGNTVTLEASTTSYVINNTGYAVKNGNSSFSLVGMVRTNSSALFVNSATQRFVRSWYNDAGFSSESPLTVDTNVALNSWNELSSSLRIEFLAWQDEVFDFSVNGTNFHAAASGKLYGTTVGLNGVSTIMDGWCVSGSPNVSSGFNYTPIGFSGNRALNEGYNYATIAARSFDGVTVTWKGNVAGGSRCCLYVKANGNSNKGAPTATSQGNVVACILRNTGSGWFILSDSDHVPVGVSSVSSSTTGITLNYNFTATKIKTFIVVPDETFATVNQFLVGASVGLSSAFVQVAVAGTPGVVNPNTIISASGNFWVYGLFE